MIGLEIIGVVFGLMCVWLVARNNVWSWPVGLVNITAYAVVFYQVGLYADVTLQVAFFFLSIYGWFSWGKIKNDLPVTRLPVETVLRLGALLPILVVSSGLFFSVYTSASVPYVDSAIMVLSLFAQWLMARKVLESWWLWIAVDVIGIGLYSYKGLYLTSGLYFIYLIICIIGLRTWNKQLKSA